MLIFQLINELEQLLKSTPEEELSDDVVAQYKITILALQDLMMHRYNNATLLELKVKTNLSIQNG